MSFHERRQVQDLVNKYRSTPRQFDDAQLDVLQNKADQYGIAFKPLRDTTTLGSLASNFASGFVKGLVPLFPPDDKPRTTYDAIAQSLGHLAGFAPSILSVPLRLGTSIARLSAGGLGLLKTADKLNKLQKQKGFVGQPLVSFLDNVSIPMKVSRGVKTGFTAATRPGAILGYGALKPGTKAFGIAEEALGLGAASTISNIWAGPDEYINTFFGGALAGGAFGGLGNWKALGNLVKGNPQQSKRVEAILKSSIGASFTGLPATLRDEPIEMQLYEYLLGGFFGYNTRPAHEAIGGQYYAGIKNDIVGGTLKPEITKSIINKVPIDFHQVNKLSQNYIYEKATQQARFKLTPEQQRQSELKARNEYGDKVTQKQIDNQVREDAYNIYIERASALPYKESKIKTVSEDTPDNRTDKFDDLTTNTINANQISENIMVDLGKLKKLETKDNIVNKLQTYAKQNIFTTNGNKLEAPNVENFINLIKQDKNLSNLFNKNIKTNYDVQLRKLFQNLSQRPLDSLTIDITGSDMQLNIQKPGRYEQDSIGMFQYNAPLINEFGKITDSSVSNFNHLRYFKTLKNKKVNFEDAGEIFNKKLDGTYQYGAEIKQLVNKLNANDQYIYAGVKDKKYLFTAKFNDKQNTLKFKDIFKKENFSQTELDVYNKEFNQSLTEFKKYYTGKNVENLHERIFVSNIRHELNNNGFLKNAEGNYSQSDIKNIITPKYFKDAVDFNKRMQGYSEASGIPLHPDSVNGKENLKFIVVKDKDMYPEFTGTETSATDGGKFFRKSIFDSILKAFGFPSSFDNIKPVTMGSVNGEFGLAFHKSNGKRATAAIEKLLNELNADYLLFESANKIKGSIKPTEVIYNKETNSYLIPTGKTANVYSSKTSTTRINPSTFEDAAKNFKGVNVPRQFFITMTKESTAGGLENFGKHYYRTPKLEQSMVDKYNNTKNFTEIENHLKKNFKNLDKFPLDFIFKHINNSTNEGNAIRRALQKVSLQDDPLVESFEIKSSNERFSMFHEKNQLLNRLGEGSFVANNVVSQIRPQYRNSVRKYILRRLTTPFWEYGGKSWLNPVTKDVFFDADMVKNRTIERGEILLDKGMKPMKVLLDITPELKIRLNVIINKQKGKVLNEQNESTLSSIWNAYKSIRKGAGKGNADIQKVLEDAFDLLVIRVPSDSASGTRLLRFKGFTNSKGTGSITHHKDDKYLGGADKDADSVFIIQGGEKNHKSEINKIALDRESLNESLLNKELGAVSPELGPLSKFSPSFRQRAYETGLQGARDRGSFISARDALYEMYLRVSNNNGSLKQKLHVKRGDRYFLEDITLSLKPNGIKKFRDDVFGFINIANDSTKFISIPTVTKANERLLSDLFIFKDSKGGIIPSKNIYAYRQGMKAGSEKIKSDLEKLYDFHSSFKTNVFLQSKKTPEYLLNLIERFQDVKLFGPVGKTFNNANYLKDPEVKRFLSNNDLEGFSHVLKRRVSDFSKQDSDKDFLRALLKSPKLEDPVAEFSKTGNFASRLDVDLNKLASYELLNERALDVFNSFNSTKQKNITSIVSALSKTYEKALKLKRDHNADIYSESTNRRSNDSATVSETINAKIESDYNKLKDFSQNNKVDYIALKKFYDHSLLLPFKPAGRNFFKASNFFFNSPQVSSSAKRDLFRKMQDIYERAQTQGEIVQERPYLNAEYVKEYFKKPKDSYEKIFSTEDKSIAISNNVIKNAKKDSKNTNDNLDFLAETKEDFKIIKSLRENIKDYPAIDSLNDYFISFQHRQNLTPKDLSTANMTDIKRLNSYFEWIKGGQKDKFKYLNWLRDPSDIAERDLALTMSKIYDKKIKVIKPSGKLEDVKLYKFTNPLSSMSSYFRKSTVKLGEVQEREGRILEKELDFKKFMTKNDQETLTELISNRVNTDEPRLSGVKYKKFLDTNFTALKTTPDFGNTKLKIVETIPTKRDKPILASYNVKTDTITIAEPMISKKFKEKAWTVSATQKDGSKSTPLPKDIFKTEQDFYNFVILHELTHKKPDFNRPRKNETLGQFEDRVNKKALSTKIKGSELLDKYTKTFSDFYDRMGKEYIYTFVDGKRFDFGNEIDIQNPKFRKVNEFIEYSKDGRFNFERFYNNAIKPFLNNKFPKGLTIEQLLRYQYEYIMEKRLVFNNNGKALTDGLQKRIQYRLNQDNNFYKNFQIGYIEPSQYWSRLNYGHNTKSKKLYEDSIKVEAQKRAEATGGTAQEIEANFIKEIEKLNISREKSMNRSARYEDAFLNYQYENVGFKNRPSNLLERQPFFIDGYDKTPNVLNTYSNRITRSLFNNVSAIFGNREIDLFSNNNNLTQQFKRNKDIEAHNIKIRNQARKLKGAARDKLLRKQYKDNVDLWSDYLFIYLKNSLGHPSLLTDRIVKSMETSDPLKLKYNPYYLTSDYAVTRGLEKLYKSNKFNKMPFLSNAPKSEAARRDYFVRRMHDLGTLEAKLNLMTILANTGTMLTNIFGGGSMNIGSAGLKNFVDSKRNKPVTEKLLKDKQGNFILNLENGKIVKNRKDLKLWLSEKGILDTISQLEIDYNQNLTDGVKKGTKNFTNFFNDIRKTFKNNNNESSLDVAQRYGVKDTLTRYGSFFMRYGERINRTDAFISHALKAKENLGNVGIETSLKDPYIFNTALKGIETTQFLYNNSQRPAFMTTSLGKVLTRFKLFAFKSVRVRQQFYREAKASGYKEGTDEYKKFKDLFAIDMFTMAMASAYMYSIFDTALPPPWDWVQDTSDLLFGDKKERDRAFYGTLPRPIAPLQVIMPPISRYPGALVELLQGDWDKFSDYTIHTMYPFGRLYYSIKKTRERPERFFENFFRLPVGKVSYRIKREQELEKRQEYIDDILDEG